MNVDYTEMHATMQDSKFILNFSRTEVFPLTFWEAYLAGTTYIASAANTSALAHTVLAERAGLILTHNSIEHLDELFDQIVNHRIMPAKPLKCARLQADESNEFVIQAWKNILI